MCIVVEGNDDVFEEQHQAAIEAGQAIGDLIFHGTEPTGKREGLIQKLSSFVTRIPQKFEYSWLINKQHTHTHTYSHCLSRVHRACMLSLVITFSRSFSIYLDVQSKCVSCCYQVSEVAAVSQILAILRVTWLQI